MSSPSPSPSWHRPILAIPIAITSTCRAAASAASIKQGIGYGADHYGAFGSSGVEDARLEKSRDRGFSSNSRVLAAKKNADVINKSHDDRQLSQSKRSRASLLGHGHHYGRGGSSGASASRKSTRVNRGTLHNARVNEQQRAQTEGIKHLNSDWSKATRSSNVDIGQGLHGAGKTEQRQGWGDGDGDGDGSCVGTLLILLYGTQLEVMAPQLRCL